MIDSANARSISELLNTERDLVYFIPKYQREYVWGRKNWELLFDDLLNNENAHFLGSIICINDSTDSIETTRLELIDGQQRMTTLSILLSAIYYHLKNRKESEAPEDEDIINDLINLKYKIILKSDKKTLRIQPSIAGQNLQDYQFIVGKELGFLRNYEQSRNAGLRRLYKCFRFFISRLEEQREDESLIFDLEATQAFLKKVNNAILVKIEVKSLSNAFTLFETLNNRGVPLSPIDLIKNSFLSELEKVDAGSIDDNYRRWLKLVENLSDEYKTQERFLRHFYNAFKNEKTHEVKGVTKALRSNLIDIYDKLIKQDAEEFFDRLYQSSEVYNQLIFPENEQNSKEVRNALLDLMHIGAAPSYALLLYVFERFSTSAEEKVQLIQFLVKYFVRRNITDLPPTRDLDNIFIDVIKQLHEHGQYDFTVVKDTLL